LSLRMRVCFGGSQLDMVAEARISTTYGVRQNSLVFGDSGIR
jgi:hypothetical protein